MKRLIDLVYSYKYYFPLIIIYEIIYIIIGYKGNKFIIRNSKSSTDTIPCPYFFLSKIYRVLIKLNVKSFTDIGCGNGRVIHYFLKKRMKCEFRGYEIFEDSYNFCRKIFQNNLKIKLFNQNFFSSDFKSSYSSCYFINDPIKSTSIHNNSFNKLINFHKREGLDAYFVIINLSDDKTEIFKNFILIKSFKIDTKGYKIYLLKNE